MSARVRIRPLQCLSAIFLFALTPWQSLAEDFALEVTVVDADSDKPISARLYLKEDNLTTSCGKHFYFESKSPEGSAVRYEKQNWINKNSTEYHTTVSAHPAVANVPAGNYRLIAERGKEYHNYENSIRVDGDTAMTVPLKRWINMSERGWYSGDLHLHRTIEELKNVLPAEDLNVAFPLTQWVTISDTLPNAGNKNQSGERPENLIKIDDEHVIWPLSTEYEIFQTSGKRHTLGALFVLGHKEPLTKTVPPWKPVVESVEKSDPLALFDMDKLAWPFAMTLPVVAPNATYELSNNHVWRTEFAFRDWYTPAPPYMAPPYGATQGGERDWINFSLGMYYTLLNCGFKMPPSAGTANGVHPVPAGFSRVYVHQPNGFDYQDWLKGLQLGRSFVTTGPMLFATADGKDSGHHFEMTSKEAQEQEIQLEVEIVSDQPRFSYGEIIVNGRPERLVRPKNLGPDDFLSRYVISVPIQVKRSGWFALRFWEELHGEIRFAHTAPWYVTIDGQPVQPMPEEKEYLISRMENEIERSRGVVSEEGMAEYREALDFYKSLSPYDESSEIKETARPFIDFEDRQKWLKNMIVDHQFTPYEIRRATGIEIDAARAAIKEVETTATPEISKVKVLPYPGGRHPRIGFLDGAINPQRETKISVFPPWENGGYVVIDVPEAIFSNLGLTYLAHTHIPTIWDEQNMTLPQLEWKQKNGDFISERTLPNGISFTSFVYPEDNGVRMKIELTNRTKEKLTGMRVQVCNMLKGAIGFNLQQEIETMSRNDSIAIKSFDDNRWIVASWTPKHRAWINRPVPCFHCDPIFPDCEPGETVEVNGELWFFEGPAHELFQEMQQLDK